MFRLSVITIAVLLIICILCVPFAVIWALNALGAGIAYSLKAWIAVVLLFALSKVRLVVK